MASYSNKSTPAEGSRRVRGVDLHERPYCAAVLDSFAGLNRGRARFTVRPSAPRPLERVGQLLAGAAQVDITPPPGMPKAGYSANAHTGVGFRTRLRARVVHLRWEAASIAVV